MKIMALKEQNHKGNTMTDKNFVALILAGDEDAGHKFVEQYSDAVFYIARKWTRLDCKYADKSDINAFATIHRGLKSGFGDKYRKPPIQQLAIMVLIVADIINQNNSTTHRSLSVVEPTFLI